MNIQNKDEFFYAELYSLQSSTAKLWIVIFVVVKSCQSLGYTGGICISI
jgi:hypothetical protein